MIINVDSTKMIEFIWF